VSLVEDNADDARLLREALARARGVAWETEDAGMLSAALQVLERSLLHRVRGRVVGRVWSFWDLSELWRAPAAPREAKERGKA
jgi:hypothetical protein